MKQKTDLERVVGVAADVDTVLGHAKEALVDGLARIERVTHAQQALVADFLDLPCEIELVSTRNKATAHVWHARAMERAPNTLVLR